jgi:hypothetical protein
MAKCIFDLENVDLDDSLLIGDDENDFYPPFKREDSDTCIEGLAALYHTGNLARLVMHLYFQFDNLNDRLH